MTKASCPCSGVGDLAARDTKDDSRARLLYAAFCRLIADFRSSSVLYFGLRPDLGREVVDVELIFFLGFRCEGISQ